MRSYSDISTTANFNYSNSSLYSTTPLTTEQTTFPWEETDKKLVRRTVYYTLHGIVGLITSLFNGLVILVYVKRLKIRKHISFVMLSMYIFCFIHGLIVGTIYPLQRLYRYKMHAHWCVFTTLVMDFCDKFILLLLPVLAVERLIHLKFPFISKRKANLWASCSIAGLLIFAMLYAWLPLVPSLDVPKETEVFSKNHERQNYLENFYLHYSCHGLINKKNYLEPIFTILVGFLCVTVVLASYIWMFMIAKARLNALSNVTVSKRRRLKRAALSVMYVALTFIITVLPLGIVIQVAAFCDADNSIKNNSFCTNITLELRFVFSVFAHLGNLLAPMLFALLNPNIRAIINAYIKRKAISSTSSHFKKDKPGDTGLAACHNQMCSSTTTEEMPRNKPVSSPAPIPKPATIRFQLAVPSKK